MSQELRKIAKETRKDILQMGYSLGDSAVHIGGCMSLVELLTVLYQKNLNFNKANFQDENRDRIIMSKGHGSIALYAAMHQCGLINDLTCVNSLLGKGNIYYKQEVRNLQAGLEFSSGSLGQGLAYGIGIARSLKKKGNNTSRVYVFIGDGECGEGSVWEAASIAGHLKLDNVVVIVDRNHLQIDGDTEQINRMDMLADRWEAFGFDVVAVNGHDMDGINMAYRVRPEGKPIAIIAETIKGKGISFAEDNVEWHQNVLTRELYENALCELGE